MNTPPDELQAEINSLRATIAELLEEREWRDIGTAPENEDVLVSFKRDGRRVVRVAYVLHGRFYGHDSPYRLEYPATHWLPLPQPPDAARQPSSGREGNSLDCPKGLR